MYKWNRFKLEVSLITACEKLHFTRFTRSSISIGKMFSFGRGSILQLRTQARLIPKHPVPLGNIVIWLTNSVFLALLVSEIENQWIRDALVSNLNEIIRRPQHDLEVQFKTTLSLSLSSSQATSAKDKIYYRGPVEENKNLQFLARDPHVIK